MTPEVIVITHPEDENLGRPPSYANTHPAWIESFSAPFGSGGPITTYLVVSPRAEDEDLACLAKRANATGNQVSVETLRKYRDSLPPRTAPYSDEGREIVEIPLLKMANA